MPAKSLGFKCPNCGRDYGSGMLKRKRMEKKEYHQQRPGFKIERDSYGNEIKECIKRVQHPYRYRSLFGNTADPAGKNEDVIINPPRPEPSENDAEEEAYKVASYLSKMVTLIVQIAPHVYGKYPSLYDDNKLEEFTRGCNIFAKYIESATDDRYRRSLNEWVSIIKTAIEESPRKASKKYSGTDGGKVIRLSQEYIRDKIPEVIEFTTDFLRYVPVFLESIADIVNAIREDPELMKTYKKYEEDYDNKRGGEKRPQQEQHSDNNNRFYYKYEYFVIRHYDPELRKQQKLNRKRGTRHSKADGKVECGPFKETDLPPKIVEELRRKIENRRSLS